MKDPKKLIIILGITILAVFVISPFNKEGKLTSEPAAEKKITKVVLVGDIMLDRNVETMMMNKNDWRWPFLNIADYLKNADLVFGNLESVISDQGYKVGSIYSFRADPRAIEGLNWAGFDVLSVVNNHAFDYTYEALVDTLNRLDSAGISHLHNFSPVIKKIKGTRIGFLAYTNLGPKTWKAVNNENGIAWVDEDDFEKIKKDIKLLKEQVDVAIISLHSGEEYQYEPTEFQENFAKMAVKAGADVVAGHHPHIVQPYEQYLDGWIFYSLGNFVFDQTFSTETKEGLMVEVSIADGKIAEVTPKKIQINYSFQPNLID